MNRPPNNALQPTGGAWSRARETGWTPPAAERQRSTDDEGTEWIRIAPCGLEASSFRGYTTGMKTAVSIPDHVFEQAERLARRTRKSRSHVFSSALREYVARHSPDDVTDAMDRVCEHVGDQGDLFVAQAARQTLEHSEW